MMVKATWFDWGKEDGVKLGIVGFSEWTYRRDKPFSYGVLLASGMSIAVLVMGCKRDEPYRCQISCGWERLLGRTLY